MSGNSHLLKLNEELDKAYDKIDKLEKENHQLRERLFKREKIRKCNPYKGRKRLLREESLDIIKKYLDEVGESTGLSQD